MKELVIISGKGGTGKTSVTAAFAALASREGKAVFADCDVDAADLHLILSPEIQKTHEFIADHEAVIDRERCISCGKCLEVCRFEAVTGTKTGGYVISGCEGCGICVALCPAQAIAFPDRRCGEWYESETRFGPMVHAALDPEAENSGKLVTLVKREAKKKAEEIGADWILVDGCPGIGCPVIASITGADAVLAVVEPSLSSRHDLERVMELARHFKVPLSVAINKADINPEVAASIGELCKKAGVLLAGTIPWDPVVTRAQLEAQSVIEYRAGSAVAEAITAIWKTIGEAL